MLDTDTNLSSFLSCWDNPHISKLLYLLLRKSQCLFITSYFWIFWMWINLMTSLGRNLKKKNVDSTTLVEMVFSWLLALRYVWLSTNFRSEAPQSCLVPSNVVVLTRFMQHKIHASELIPTKNIFGSSCLGSMLLSSVVPWKIYTSHVQSFWA